VTLKNHDFAIQNVILWHNQGVLHNKADSYSSWLCIW